MAQTINAMVTQSEAALQSKSVTPTENSQSVTPDAGYDGLSSVSVGAIASDYVGSGVPRKSSSDLTASGGTVTAPAGYYAEAAEKALPEMGALTPDSTVTRDLVRKRVAVVPYVDVSAGYNSFTGRYSGTTKYVTAALTDWGSIGILRNGTYDVTGYQEVVVTVPAPEPSLQDKTVTANGTYTADQGYDGLGEVTVNLQPSYTQLQDGTYEMTINGGDLIIE